MRKIITKGNYSEEAAVVLKKAGHLSLAQRLFSKEARQKHAVAQKLAQYLIEADLKRNPGMRQQVIDSKKSRLVMNSAGELVATSGVELGATVIPTKRVFGKMMPQVQEVSLKNIEKGKPPFSWSMIEAEQEIKAGRKSPAKKQKKAIGIYGQDFIIEEYAKRVLSAGGKPQIERTIINKKEVKAFKVTNVSLSGKKRVSMKLKNGKTLHFIVNEKFAEKLKEFFK
ncbi:MAG: hypothetical protein WC462_01710 [archaeon]